MNGYVKADEIAVRWNITERQVQVLCKAGRVEGAVKFGNTWAIPENAFKPTRTAVVKQGPRRKQDG
jgi:hypothetical protein